MQAREDFEAYGQVPFNAQLEVWEELEEGAVQIDARVISSAGPQDDEEWDTAELLRTEANPEQAGRKILTAPKGYMLRVSTFFQNRVRGRLNVRILKEPGGGEHSKPFFWPLDGDQGDNHLGGVFIRMAGGAQ